MIAAVLSRHPRFVRALVVFGAILMIAPLVTASSLTAQSLQDVERRVEDLTDRLDQATQRFEDVRARVEQTEAELQGLEVRAAELEIQAARAEEALASRARDVFKRGGDPVLSSMLSADGIVAVVERAQFLGVVTSREHAGLEEAIALRQQLEQLEVMIADRAAQLADLEEQLAAERDTIDRELGQQTALASDLRARAARQRRIDNAVQSGLYACIHDRNSFVDSWGAPRSGGRRHKGVDVMAPYNVPVYAFTNGRITRMNRSSLGGIQIYMWGDDNNQYFYAHLAGYASGLHVGMRVEAGQLIAYNGDTGNARGSPHVHFEIHPGGGGAINPYPYMRAACR